MAPRSQRYFARWQADPAWMLLVHTASIFAAIVVWNFFVKIDSCYIFSEYVLKFVPFLLRAKPLDLFDSWAMGDPRPRIVTVLAEVVNLHLRDALSRITVLPPAFGINWAIYPCVCVVLFRTGAMLTGRRIAGLAVSLLWAVSPPALDSLVLCYVPAKALMNLWFALAIFSGARLEQLRSGAVTPARARAAKRAKIQLALVIALSFLTDETAAIIVGCVPILFYRCFIPARATWKETAATWSAIVGPIAFFAAVALFIYPALNRIGDQASLDYVAMALKGPSVGFKGDPNAQLYSTHFATFKENFQPLGTAFTMFTAHLLPNRRVEGFWTFSRPLTWDVWPVYERWALGLFLTSISCIIAFLPPIRRRFVFALLAAIVCLIVLYAILLVPLAPAILEVNYYGSLFSVLYALLIALLLADVGTQPSLRILCVTLIAFLACLEMGSYFSTARRNRLHYSNHQGAWNQGREIEWNYRVLRSIAKEVSAGRFRQIAAIYPYPSRAFCYAFELDADRLERQRQPIDFVPNERSDCLYDIVLHQHIDWLKSIGVTFPLVSTGPSKAQEIAKGARVLTSDELAALVNHSTWHGATDLCEFTRTYGQNGRFEERFWLKSVMRIWRQQGTATIVADHIIRVEGSRTGTQHLSDLLERGGVYMAFDERGYCCLRFQLIARLHL